MTLAVFRAFLLAVLVSRACAGLVWDDTTATIETHGSPETRRAEFRFRNESDRPVRIRGVDSSCGCTVAKPEKEVYAPGESGVLPVTHKPKPGPQARSYLITVTTDEGRKRIYDLRLVVRGQSRLVLDGSRMFVWEKGEAREPKQIAIATRTGDPLRLTGAEADGKVVSVELDGEGASRLLRVTPKKGAAGRARIRVLSDPPLSESEATFFAVLR